MATSAAGRFVCLDPAITLWRLRWLEWELDTAARRSRELGLDISFVCADVTDLSSIADESFDIVYTGGHVAIWVADLRKYYQEAVRILKSGGMFLVMEYHPIRRIWKETPDGLALAVNYYDRGPHRFDRSEQVPDAPEGAFPGFEVNWTLGDYVQALLAAGCELLWLDEIGDASEAWEVPPLEGLPECLMLAGRKRGS